MLQSESELERTILKPLRHTSVQFYFVLAGLGLVFFWGAAALANQWWLGLGVTGLNRPVYWGIYLSNFIFFSGLSMSGTLISAILRITQAEWRRPVTRLADDALTARLQSLKQEEMATLNSSCAARSVAFGNRLVSLGKRISALED